MRSFIVILSYLTKTIRTTQTQYTTMRQRLYGCATTSTSKIKQLSKTIASNRQYKWRIIAYSEEAKK